MIDSLRIRNLGVIEDATIDLGPGLTAITGETGAGKTMLLTGLNLVRGQKVDARVVRKGSERADAESHWVITGDRAVSVREMVADAGGDVEEDPSGITLVIARTVLAEGRGKCFAGGRAVPAGTLEQLAAELIAVHGQSDQAFLRSPARQRELLDRYGGPGVTSALANFAQAYAAWRHAREALRARREGATAWRAELAMLEVGLQRIDDVRPESGEDAEVERRLRILEHSGALLEDVSTALVGLRGDDDLDGGARGRLHESLRALDRAQAADGDLEESLARLRSALVELDDVEHALSAYLADLDADPAQQTWLEVRRAALTSLKRAYGPELSDVIDWAETARAKVAEAVEFDDEALADQVVQLQATMVSTAQALTAERRDAASRLALAVTAELAHLALGDAALSVEVLTDEDPERWTASGADFVEFMLSANRGLDSRALAKTASGGELSRVMLALEVVLAGADPVPTFVFDEIDAGVGGRAAVEIGRRLSRLARTRQVLVVTHLPQVAAFADRQIVVRKQADGQVTSSDVTAVTGDERVAELVRMMAGFEASESGAAHARELLALAESARASES